MSEQLRVVVVDDDPAVRETIEAYLDPHGIRASVADGLGLARYLQDFPTSASSW